MTHSQGFTIVIPTFNRARLLQTTLDSLQKLRLPNGWSAEILVINNNSKDHTQQVVEQFAQRGSIPTRHITEKRQGASYSRNRAIQEAQFDHLAFFDDDVLVDPGWLDGYVRAIEALRADLVVGPIEPWFETPPDQELLKPLLNAITQSYTRKGDELLLLPSELGHEVPGCNFGVRRDVAIEVGGFNEMLGRPENSMLGGEDSEFGEKVVLLGKRVAYAPQCRIRHFVSMKKLSKAGLRDRWEIGYGASQRALLRLRNEDLSVWRRVRLFARMVRFFLRSLFGRMTGDKTAALFWELNALRIRGLLFKCPLAIKPRKWPPATHFDLGHDSNLT